MKRILRIALSCAILLAFVYLASAAAAMIPRDWIPLPLFVLTLLLFFAYIRLARENHQLEEQIRELEMGLGL